MRHSICGLLIFLSSSMAASAETDEDVWHLAESHFICAVILDFRTPDPDSEAYVQVSERLSRHMSAGLAFGRRDLSQPTIFTGENQSASLIYRLNSFPSPNHDFQLGRIFQDLRTEFLESTSEARKINGRFGNDQFVRGEYRRRNCQHLPEEPG